MQILGILNELPVTRSKYQFTMTMADRIMDGNARDDHAELLYVNRTALSSAFARTSTLLYRYLESSSQQSQVEDIGAWTTLTRLVKALPLGSFIAPFLKGTGILHECGDVNMGEYY
ncbi:hypothetical protein Dsin_009440 [Dipteronia sinensis]|uniref:Uncharacterized protein n=1 Tax=Dipteronia sinensis TaxID=43782 RepID=A0AAE0EDH2_9ROSI|nr:hypothetical protein Dsin_009440 [Dipteronia sinensis]